MTTFVAALHLPYMVHFDEDVDSPTTKDRFPPPRGRSSQDSSTPKAKPNIELPQSTLEMPIHDATPYDPATPMPNLLRSLGHVPISSASPTSPMTPRASGGEELFFQLDVADHSALGSPSDPSTSLRKPTTAKFSHTARTHALPTMVPTLTGDRTEDGGYFAIPTAAMTANRTKRRSSASDRPIEDQGWTVERNDYGNGGLKNAVEAAVEARHLTEKVSVGTLGYGTSGLDESTKVAIEGTLRDDYQCLVAFTSDEDFDGHYNHYCKEVLWPVFHYQIPDHPKSKAFLDHSWKYFEAVNRAIADVIIHDYKRGDTIWVNDYHLVLVPKLLREALGPDAKIGFFLHVGFPSSEIFRCLAHRGRLLEGMLGATLIGFQTEEYARHFLTTCGRLLNVEARNDGVMLEHNFIKVISLPIGIDPLQLGKKRSEEKVEEWARALRERYAGKRLLVARDKLDGVRGVRQKLLAFELFLKRYPVWVGKVVLIQVALTTTSIVEVLSTVTDIVTRINCEYSTLDYQPVVYLHQDITYHQYIALLQIADALVVTSLRDGMNLTSHEFVYLQDQKHSPLILSEFTGSAAVFKGAEISVNPWDQSMVAQALVEALTMSEDEKKLRWRRLYKAVMRQTAKHWFSGFLELLGEACEEQQRCGTSVIPRLSSKHLVECYKRSKKRLFLLDYEGTLVSWGSPNSNIITSPQRVLDIVNDLLEDLTNVVYIMSSRPLQDLEQIFLRVPGVGLVAESGCFFRPFQKDRWVRLANERLPWKRSVREILDYYVERTPGTFVEERTCSYVWHLEKAEDPLLAGRQAGDCCNHVNDSCETFQIHAVPITRGVVVESLEWTKVTACQKIMDMLQERNWMVDFVMVAGDGRDDESVFEWIDQVAKEEKIPHLTTVRIGTGHSRANATTNGVSGVITALMKLATISASGH